MKSLMMEAEKIQETIAKHRRFIHENAEIDMDLPITANYVKTQLKAMGYEPKEICQSGIVATVGKKKDGKTFLLRADMDGLPIKEENDLPFKSKTDYMHACGHDLHAAMLLGAAQLLKDHEDEINGQVKLMFQPAEETFSGANEMIKAGVLENPKVNAAMMIHVGSGMPIKPGTVMVMGHGVIQAASDWFKITVQGKGCHGAMSNMGVDPLNVLTHIYLSLQNINAREVAPGEISVITIGEMHGGNTGNIIPDTAYMQGTIRVFDEKNRVFIKERIESISKNIAESFRASATVEFFRGCPSNVNDQKISNQVNGYIKNFVGDSNFLDMTKIPEFNKPNTASEDFAYIAQNVPSISIFLASGSSMDGYKYPAHHPKVTFDESRLYVGAGIYAHSALEWLNNN